MREYTTLTREAVDVVEGAAQYMSETTPMEHWSDKMLEPELRAACTTCALKAGVAAGGKH